MDGSRPNASASGPSRGPMDERPNDARTGESSKPTPKFGACKKVANKNDEISVMATSILGPFSFSGEELKPDLIGAEREPITPLQPLTENPLSSAELTQNTTTSSKALPSGPAGETSGGGADMVRPNLLAEGASNRVSAPLNRPPTHRLQVQKLKEQARKNDSQRAGQLFQVPKQKKSDAGSSSSSSATSKSSEARKQGTMGKTGSLHSQSGTSSVKKVPSVGSSSSEVSPQDTMRQGGKSNSSLTSSSNKGSHGHVEKHSVSKQPVSSRVSPTESSSMPQDELGVSQSSISTKQPKASSKTHSLVSVTPIRSNSGQATEKEKSASSHKVPTVHQGKAEGAKLFSLEPAGAGKTPQSHAPSPLSSKVKANTQSSGYRQQMAAAMPLSIDLSTSWAIASISPTKDESSKEKVAATQVGVSRTVKNGNVAHQTKPKVPSDTFSPAVIDDSATAAASAADLAPTVTQSNKLKVKEYSALATKAMIAAKKRSTSPSEKLFSCGSGKTKKAGKKQESQQHGINPANIRQSAVTKSSQAKKKGQGLVVDTKKMTTIFAEMNSKGSYSPVTAIAETPTVRQHEAKRPFGIVSSNPCSASSSDDSISSSPPQVPKVPTFQVTAVPSSGTEQRSGPASFVPVTGTLIADLTASSSDEDSDSDSDNSDSECECLSAPDVSQKPQPPLVASGDGGDAIHSDSNSEDDSGSGSSSDSDSSGSGSSSDSNNGSGTDTDTSSSSGSDGDDDDVIENDDHGKKPVDDTQNVAGKRSNYFHDDNHDLSVSSSCASSSSSSSSSSDDDDDDSSDDEQEEDAEELEATQTTTDTTQSVAASSGRGSTSTATITRIPSPVSVTSVPVTPASKLHHPEPKPQQPRDLWQQKANINKRISPIESFQKLTGEKQPLETISPLNSPVPKGPHSSSGDYDFPTSEDDPADREMLMRHKNSAKKSALATSRSPGNPVKAKKPSSDSAANRFPKPTLETSNSVHSSRKPQQKRSLSPVANIPGTVAKQQVKRARQEEDESTPTPDKSAKRKRPSCANTTDDMLNGPSKKVENPLRRRGEPSSEQPAKKKREASTRPGGERGAVATRSPPERYPLQRNGRSAFDIPADGASARSTGQQRSRATDGAPETTSAARSNTADSNQRVNGTSQQQQRQSPSNTVRTHSPSVGALWSPSNIGSTQSPQQNKSEYLAQAKKLKYEGDNKKLPIHRRAAKYLEAAMLFIRYAAAMEGQAMASNNPEERKAARSCYTETIGILGFISVLSRLEKSDVRQEILIISIRCMAVLSMKIFEMRLEVTKKENHSLNETFKSVNTQKATNQPVSPPTSSGGSSNGGPSPNPSPASLVPTPPEAGRAPSATAAHGTNGTGGSTGKTGNNVVGPSTPTSTVQFPQRLVMAGMTTCKFMTHAIDAVTHWQRADRKMTETQDFFARLNRECGEIHLMSSIAKLIEWCERGLQRCEQSSRPTARSRDTTV